MFIEVVAVIFDGRELKGPITWETKERTQIINTNRIIAFAKCREKGFENCTKLMCINSEGESTPVIVKHAFEDVRQALGVHPIRQLEPA